MEFQSDQMEVMCAMYLKFDGLLIYILLQFTLISQIDE